MNTKKSHPALVVLILFLGYCVVYLDKLTISFTIVPLAKEVGLEASQKGMIMSAFFLGYALMQFPMGFVSNKIGSKKVLCLSILLISAFSFMFGFASSFIFFIFIRFFAGLLAHSGYPASASKQLTLNVPEDKRTMSQGFLLAASGVAGIVGPLFLTPIIEKTNWQTAYYIMSGAALIVTLLIVLILPRDKQVTQQQTTLEKVSFTEVITNYNVITMFISLFFLNAIAYGMSNWMPSFFTEERGLALSQTSQIMSIAGFTSLAGSIASGLIISKFFKGKEKFAASGSLLIGAVSIILVYLVQSPALMTVFLAITNFFVILSFVTIMSIPFKLFIGANFTPSYAAISTGGILGGFVAPMIIGFLVQSTGTYFSTFVFFLVCASFSALIILFVRLPQTQPNLQKEKQKA